MSAGSPIGLLLTLTYATGGGGGGSDDGIRPTHVTFWTENRERYDNDQRTRFWNEQRSSGDQG